MHENELNCAAEEPEFKYKEPQKKKMIRSSVRNDDENN